MHIVYRSTLLAILLSLGIGAHVASVANAIDSTPAGASSNTGAALQQRFAEAEAAELTGFDHDRENPKLAIDYFRRAAELFESIAQQRYDPVAISEAYWRSARSYWLVADAMPRDANDEREPYYVRSEALAEKGIEVNPECAGCMLWKFSSMGRLATARGVWSAGRQIPVMADLLERGIALQPSHADNDQNSVLGNLHYSSAIFYRVLPDWFFMTWFFGVRGDKQRSLQHIETALDFHPTRIEYQVELGSQLLCRGTSKDDPEQLERGRQVLLEAAARAPKSLDDEREIEAAGIMLDEPGKACGYSGDTWLEIDRKRARQVVKEQSPR
jgi:hypothetical protein